jgi:hypothetical protein
MTLGRRVPGAAVPADSRIDPFWSELCPGAAGNLTKLACATAAGHCRARRTQGETVMTNARIATLIIGLAAALCPASAFGQPRRGDVRIETGNFGVAVRLQEEVIQVPCCRCVDGSTSSVSVNTGTAPWTMASPAPVSTGPAGPATHPAWAVLAPASWVGLPVSESRTGTYTYELKFSIPSCVIPSQFIVSGQFAADNDGRLFVLPYPAALKVTPSSIGFQQGSVTPFQWGLASPGIHTLRVTVHNDDGPTGLILRGAITIGCPADPIAQPGSATSSPSKRN